MCYLLMYFVKVNKEIGLPCTGHLIFESNEYNDNLKLRNQAIRLNNSEEAMLQFTQALLRDSNSILIHFL